MRAARFTRLVGAGAMSVALGGGLLIVPMVSPASAHETTDAHGAISVTPGGDVAATPTLSGTFKGTEFVGLSAENINTISLTLKPTTPTAGDLVTVNGCDFVTAGQCMTATASFSWTPATPAYNGPYELSATAGHCLTVCVSPSTARFSAAPFRLGIVPKTPADVQVAAAPDRSVTVSWARNTEPDMLYYAVFRKAPGAANFTRIGGDIKQPASGRASLADTTTPDGGVYAYVVVAVRKGVTGDDKSTKTSVASAEKSVTLEFPIPPTTVSPALPGQPGVTAAPQAVPAGAGVSISGFLSQQPAPKPAPGPKYLDLPDTGFGQTLPFDPSAPETDIEGDTQVGEAPLPVIDEPGQRVSLTRPLVPVAGGAILLVLAGHVRLLNRKVKETPPVKLSDGSFFPMPPPVSRKEAKTATATPAPLAVVAPESSWVDFEPPPIEHAVAEGGSYSASDTAGYYMQAAAPYYEEASPILEKTSPILDDNDVFDGDQPSVDQPSGDPPLAESAELAELAESAPVLPAGVDVGNSLDDHDDDDAWEEEMVWEVVSPSR